MAKRKRIFDLMSLAFACGFFIFTFFYFFSDTGLFADSLVSAAIAAMVAWMTYILIRVCVLSFRR